MDKVERIRELVQLLDRAAYAYEQGDREIMSNFEYDKLYDELLALEQETGFVMANSPTQRAGYEVSSELPKERHETPMLSLDKTKDREALVAWLLDREGLLSWKMDGLTVVLTYQDGELAKAVTRGNGEIGEVITANARQFKNLPLRIPYTGELILRGEAVIRYSDFEEINSRIEKEEERYKNPRNLCSGTVRQLDSGVVAKRSVYLYAFALIRKGGDDGYPTRSEQFAFLKEQGFDVVENYKVSAETVGEAVEVFAQKVAENDFPSDGLVLTFDDIAYGKSLGRTSKFPRDSIAFKWQDEVRTTHLLEVEWSPSRTGLINPVAIFEPVELEGTTVSRASLHNISIIEELELGIGDEIGVYKANMIIPQLARNNTRSGSLMIPTTCPVCGGTAEVRSVNAAKSLFCTNPQCLAKKVKGFAHFVGRDAMNIEGMSEATIEKFIGQGMIREYADFFRLERFRERIVAMEGFGERSYENIIAATNRARMVGMPNFLYSLGILNVGLANAKLICRAFSYDFTRVCEASAEELTSIEGIGDVIAYSFVQYMQDEIHRQEIAQLLMEVTFEAAAIVQDSAIGGKVFVITGAVTHWENREELKTYIESLGGKVTGSVTKKTDYLINNDTTSTSSKNKKAKELGIPVLSEEDFLSMLEQ